MLGAPIPDPSQVPTASVAWSPDGRTIAVTDGDQTMRLFDVATRQEVGPPFQLGTPSSNTVGYTTYAAFTPDGAHVVVTNDTGRTWIIPVSLKAWEDRACAVANRNFYRKEWEHFLLGTPYRQTCQPTPGG